MWCLYLLIKISIVQTIYLTSAIEIAQELENGKSGPSDNLIKNQVDTPNDIWQNHNNWIIFTKKITKKLRETNFDNYTLNDNNISDQLRVDKGWKSRIIKGLQTHGQTVAPLQLKQSLKNAEGSLTVLSTSATLNPRYARFLNHTLKLL